MSMYSYPLFNFDFANVRSRLFEMTGISGCVLGYPLIVEEHLRQISWVHSSVLMLEEKNQLDMTAARVHQRHVVSFVGMIRHSENVAHISV